MTNHSLNKIAGVALGLMVFMPLASQAAGTCPGAPASGGITALNLSITDRGWTSANLKWETPTPARSKIYFSRQSPLVLAQASVVSDSEFVTSHALSLSGLEPGVTYYVVAESQDAAGRVLRSGERSFRTRSFDVSGPMISALSLFDVGWTSFIVRWMTNELATSAVYYASTSPLALNAATCVGDDAFVTNHGLSATGLEPARTYYIMVESQDAVGNVVTSNELALTTKGTIPAPQVTPPFTSFTPPPAPSPTPAPTPAPTPTPTGDTTAPAMSLPYVFELTSTGARISWTTNESSTSTVYYSLNSPVDVTRAAVVGSSAMETGHVITLSGLTPSTTYYFVTESRDASHNTARSTQSVFSTQPDRFFQF